MTIADILDSLESNTSLITGLVHDADDDADVKTDALDLLYRQMANLVVTAINHKGQ